MTAFTLPGRQRLSTRVPSFGGANGRGTRRVFRFGDMVQDKQKATQFIAALDAGTVHTPYSVADTVDVLDWAALYTADPVWARNAFTRMVSGTMDPANTVETWIAQHGGSITPVTPPVNTPATPDPTPSNTVVTPGMTDAQYQAALLAAQTEALRLATANAAAAAQAAKNQSAADAATAAEIARENVLRQNTPAPAVPVAPKSNALPWLIAAGVAFLALKG